MTPIVHKLRKQGIVLNPFYKANVTLLLKSDKNARRKGNCSLTSLMNTDIEDP